MERENSLIGHAIETADGKIVAYYEGDDGDKRQVGAGMTIINQRTGQSLAFANQPGELLVNFDFLFDQGQEDKPVVGYIAMVSDEERFRAGKADLVIGAIPGMTKNTVAENVLFTDLPTVRSDGSLAVILWQQQNKAALVSFRIDDGAILDRAEIDLPQLEDDRVSQGPGRSFDSALLRRPEHSPPTSGECVF